MNWKRSQSNLHTHNTQSLRACAPAHVRKRAEEAHRGEAHRGLTGVSPYALIADNAADQPNNLAKGHPPL